MNEHELIDELLDHGWTLSDLRRASELLTELERSAEARKVMEDLDRLRVAMGSKREADGVVTDVGDTEPAGGWQAFEQRLVDGAMKGAVGGGAESGRKGGWQLVRWLRTGALAATVGLAAAGWCFYWFAAPAPVAPGQHRQVMAPASAASFAAMSPQDREQQRRVFDHVAQVFDDRATWVAVSGRDSEMGVGSKPIGQQNRLLVLRLSASRGGQLVSRCDLVIVPGQEADLTVPLENGGQLRYRIGTTLQSPARLSLWVELREPDGEGRTIAALATDLAARSGQVIRAGELATTAGDYRFDLGFYESRPRESGPKT